MAKLLLVPGERIEATLKVPARAWLARYLACFGFFALGLWFWRIFHSDRWMAGSQGPRWQFWHYIYGNSTAAHLIVVVALAGGGAVWSYAKNRWNPLGWGIAASVFVFVAEVMYPGDYARVLPLATMTLTAAALMVVEVDRVTRVTQFTNLRTASYGGWRRPVIAVRHEDVKDIEVRHAPLGRMLDVGTLVPILQRQVPKAPDAGAASAERPATPPKRKRKTASAPAPETPAQAVARKPDPVFRHIHPVSRARDLLQLLIRDATATPYLREQEQLERRLTEGKLALHRRGRFSPRTR